MSRAETLLLLAKEARAVLTTAESCTGGMVAAAITDVPGSSEIFDRGFVTYSNDAKAEMLGVRAQTLEKFGAVSEEVAIEMASGALSAGEATHAVSITGIAGPGGSEHKPEGRVCFCVAGEAEGFRSFTVEFGALGRAKVREAARDYALDLLIAALS
ncbi:C-terminal domain of CinA type S [Candidatus Rhodobacter oscarellae]|uniref:C-terminal domain of CinA type S n=1 Tax=Candidatus Rhodobacter oscarellae TaxID=1675527 RepID=A0A0J9E3K6_9RHOB|nr:CinA family protein [Candidatus Rhodobacter lobularis]KMW57365.1 C-terminal domain of CinA type S [Candidatus Rhodobacter lobularis]